MKNRRVPAIVVIVVVVALLIVVYPIIFRCGQQMVMSASFLRLNGLSR